MIRFLDVVLSVAGLAAAAPLMVFIVVVGYFDTGTPLFRQVRLGRNRRPFVLYKFRTMRPDAPQVATHEASPELITPWGRFLRRSKLDELPQLWNVLKGEMSLVGPRPCLPTQSALIAERERLGVFAVRPGITGLAQIRGVDMSDPARLAQVDAEMLRGFGVARYLRILLATALGAGSGDRVRMANGKESQ